MRSRLSFVFVALFSLVPAAVRAQVGHDPAKSPYLDLEYNQEITILAGYLRARHDPAGVAPLSRPLTGIRYELRLTGPLLLSTDFTTAFGSRHVVEPLNPTATRAKPDQSNGVYTGDLALALDLTGQRSWHNLVPQLRGGFGVVHSGAADDSSGFSFGTRFAFVLGGGVKYVPAGGRVQFRADVTDRIFKLEYPDAYYRLASDNTAVIPTSTERSFYTHHTALTVGVSYLFAR